MDIFNLVVGAVLAVVMFTPHGRVTIGTVAVGLAVLFAVAGVGPSAALAATGFAWLLTALVPVEGRLLPAENPVRVRRRSTSQHVSTHVDTVPVSFPFFVNDAYEDLPVTPEPVELDRLMVTRPQPRPGSVPMNRASDR